MASSGSAVATTQGRQAARFPNHFWTYDFTEDRTARGERVRILAVIDEYTRECLLLHAARSIPSDKALDVLEWLFTTRGILHHLRSDNGPEFIAHRVQSWLAQQQCHTLYIESGHPWENPYIESFIGTLGHDCLNRYCFDNLREVQQIIEDCQEQYNHQRPHSSLNYLTPVEFAAQYWAEVIPLTPTGT